MQLVRSLFTWPLTILSLRKPAPLTLPKLAHLDLDRSIYSPSLHNDFLNIPVDRDLTAWRKYAIKFVDNFGSSTAAADNAEEFVVKSGDTDIKLQCLVSNEVVAQEEMAAVPSEEEMAKMIDEAMQALSNLNGCIRHREGWWTYEVCHMKRIRQYHAITAADQAELLKQPGKRNKPVPKVGAVSSEYLLGRFLPNQPRSTDIKFGNVFTMTYRDGETCRIADRGVVNRVTEVRFVCGTGSVGTLSSEQSSQSSSGKQSQQRLAPYFIDVFERQLCNYVIIIGVPALCSIPAFQPWTRPKQTILCSSSDTADVSTATPPADTAAPTTESIRLEKLQELVDTSSDSFPLLRQAIMDLLQSEFASVMPDPLNSHIPRRSLYDVFADLAEGTTSVDGDVRGEETGVKREERVDDDEKDDREPPGENVFQFRVDL